jgi:hypothetical protein
VPESAFNGMGDGATLRGDDFSERVNGISKQEHTLSSKGDVFSGWGGVCSDRGDGFSKDE